MHQSLPDRQIMYQALTNRDTRFDGIFVFGVTSTGIFCRPSCTARKPKPEHVEYFSTARDALLHGYRPCKICSPLAAPGSAPAWLQPLLDEIETNPEQRLKDSDLLIRGLDPNRVRRWFKKHHNMTFQTYVRTLRISRAFGRIKHGDKVIEAAYASGYESLSGFTESFRKLTGLSPNHARFNNLITITRVVTPLGPMLAGATQDGICLLEFIDRRMIETQLQRLRRLLRAELLPGSHTLFRQLEEELQEYFNGQRTEFSIPLVTKGTPFQQRVWDMLRTIPYGETRSYAEQATAIGQPKAVRAVARANGDNRIAIIIPCHRVIGADGSLTGYGGGLWRKQYLLNLEAH